MYRCKSNRSFTGAHYDLRSLTLPTTATNAYRIIDGDIPCTPEIEPSFGYVWNFCANVPSASVPEDCTKMGKSGVVLQYAHYSDADYYCYILGHYDPSLHELYYSFLDPKDPSKGVSLKYPNGEPCTKSNQKKRTAQIDVHCANVESVVVSAQEPEACEYHMIMKSYYGCPTVRKYIISLFFLAY